MEVDRRGRGIDGERASLEQDEIIGAESQDIIRRMHHEMAKERGLQLAHPEMHRR